MRILHIGQHHERVGGAEVLREQVLVGLSERGYVNGFFGGSTQLSFQDGDRFVVRRPEYDPEVLIRDGRFQMELARCLASFRPDVVHLHQVSGLPVDLYAQLGETGLPIVETIYDYGHFCPNSWSVHGNGQPCESGAGAECFRHQCHKNYPFHAGTVWTTMSRLKYVREWVDVLVCPTADLVRRFGEAGFTEVQQHSYYPSTAGLAPRALAERAPDRLLVVARLVREKGVGVALEAFARIATRRPAAHLAVVGEGPEREALERRAVRLGIADRVQFLGHLSLEQTHAQMREARVLIVPSIWMEALPLVTFDADALGLPIVATSLGGLPGAVDPARNGLLVEPGNSQAIAEAVEKILGDPAIEAKFAAYGTDRPSAPGPSQYLDGLEQAYCRARELGAAREPGQRGSVDLDERVLLDQVMRHAGSLEKAIAVRGPAQPLVRLRLLARRVAGKALERARGLLRGPTPAGAGEVDPSPDQGKRPAQNRPAGQSNLDRRRA